MNDEFAFIEKIRPITTSQSSLVKGIGDDAAVYSGSSMDEIVCIDTMVEDVHFTKKTLSPFQLGKKALAVNISDLAAMGAVPTYYLVSIAIPATWAEKELIDLYKGLRAMAENFQMDLIGGDTVSTNDKLVVTVTAIGRIEKGRALYRHNAKPGDVVFVTGAVGASQAGLQLLLDKGRMASFTDAEQQLIVAHQEPFPHVEAGRLLAKSNKRMALNDSSDGIGSEAHEIAEASHVQITIDRSAIPFHKGLTEYSLKQKVDLALFGGEDFVLIGTVARDESHEIDALFQKYKHPFYIIGSVEAGEPNVFLKDGKSNYEIGKFGYNHFQGRGEQK